MELLRNMAREDLGAVWFRHEDTDFHVLIRYMDRDDILRGMKQAKEITFDRKTHRKEEDFSEEKYDRYLARHAILDWRGLTPDVLKQFYPFKRELLEQIPPEGVSFNVENAEFLMRTSTTFRLWIDECMKDTEAFSQEEREEQEKNLGASSPGSET